MDKNDEIRQEIQSREDEKEKFLKNVYDFLEAAVSAILFICIIFIFVCRFLSVEGSSMLPTLSNGDRVIASSRQYEPNRGDIVIATQPNAFDEPIIKRVIAVGGQTVEISDGYVYVDGERLNEPYVADLTWETGDAAYPLLIPEGYLFVMGDNRNRSTDSRFDNIGLIREQYILGKVIGRWMPFGRWDVYANE